MYSTDLDVERQFVVADQLAVVAASIGTRDDDDHVVGLGVRTGR